MRVLIDESLPIELALDLADLGARAVAELGWSGLKNGALLERAEGALFGALITGDQSLPYQQHLEGRQLVVIILKARTTRIRDVRPLVPLIRQALAIVTPGQVIRLEK